MQQLALSFFIVFSFANASSQTCKYAKNEINTFSGKKLIVTKASLFIQIMPPTDCSIFFKLDNDSLTIAVDYEEQFGPTIESDLTSELWFSLSDGSLMKLKPTHSFKGQTSNFGSHGSIGHFKPTYSITQEQLGVLSKTFIKSFRLSLIQSAIEHEVGEKNQKKIADAALCLVSAIGVSLTGK